MIKIKNVCKKFNSLGGNFVALNDISFCIEKSSFTIIAGENGSGKSVLMSILAGLEDADSGSVECSESVGLIFQEADTQILGETLREDVSFGLRNLGLKKDELNKAVDSALKKVNLFDKAEFSARFLSGGEKRRLAIACMIAMDFNILILDEPYANLDFKSVHQLNELLKELKSEGKTIIVLSHEIEKCLGLSDKFIVLYKGQKVFDSISKDVLCEDLEKWNIKNPVTKYENFEDFVW